MNYPPPLPVAEQVALCLRAQQGDKAARDRLVLTTMRLVAQRAHFRARISPASDAEDLTAEGVLGLMRAIEKYDPSGGASFASYAFGWIDNSVREAANRDAGKSDALIRHGKAVADYHRLRAEVGHDEALRLAAEANGSTPKTLRARVEAMGRGVARSLDAPAYEDGPALVDVIPSAGPTVEDGVAESERSEIAQSAIERLRRRLTARERAILGRLVEHEDDAPTLAEVGAAFGVTKERIRQLESKIRKRLHTAIRRAFMERYRSAQPFNVAAYMRDYRARKHKSGLCSVCTNPHEPGMRMCAKHLARARAFGERHRRSRGQGPKRSVMITHDGQTFSAAEWSRRTGLFVSLILYRFKAGWTPERVLSTDKKPGAHKKLVCARGHALATHGRDKHGMCNGCKRARYLELKSAGCIGCGRATDNGGVRCSTCKTKRRATARHRADAGGITAVFGAS